MEKNTEDTDLLRRKLRRKSVIRYIKWRRENAMFIALVLLVIIIREAIIVLNTFQKYTSEEVDPIEQKMFWDSFEKDTNVIFHHVWRNLAFAGICFLIMVIYIMTSSNRYLLKTDYSFEITQWVQSLPTHLYILLYLLVLSVIAGYSTYMAGITMHGSAAYYFDKYFDLTEKQIEKLDNLDSYMTIFTTVFVIATLFFVEPLFGTPFVLVASIVLGTSWVLLGQFIEKRLAFKSEIIPLASEKMEEQLTVGGVNCEALSIMNLLLDEKRADLLMQVYFEKGSAAKKALRELSKIYHPDRNPTCTEMANGTFLFIQDVVDKKKA